MDKEQNLNKTDKALRIADVTSSSCRNVDLFGNNSLTN